MFVAFPNVQKTFESLSCKRKWVNPHNNNQLFMHHLGGTKTILYYLENLKDVAFNQSLNPNKHQECVRLLISVELTYWPTWHILVAWSWEEQFLLLLSTLKILAKAYVSFEGWEHLLKGRKVGIREKSCFGGFECVRSGVFNGMLASSCLQGSY